MKPGALTRLGPFAGPALILFAAAVAVAPQCLRGNSCGHDFDFHLVSWLDAQSAWRLGIPYPHWTPSANFGAGEPRFVFYPPLTWMLGAALGFVLPWQLVPTAMTFLLLAGTGLATRALARLALPSGAATLAGCTALFSGYALFTAYERSAFAELAGGCWIPLVLLFILREGNPSVPASACSAWRLALDGSTAPLALAVAGAWLSNPTVGVMACYLLAAVALTLAGLSFSWAPVLRASAGVVLGMGLVAAYLVPASWEQRWVDIHQVTQDPGQTLENNWLFAVHADPSLGLHDAVLRQASVIAVVMIAVALGGLLVSWLRGRLRGQQRWWIPFALITAAVLFLQFPVSRPLWNLLPELRFLQFPWRWLLVLEAPMAICLVSAVWPAAPARRWSRVAVATACTMAFLAMTAFAEKEFFQVCDEDDAVPGMLDRYRSGQGFIGTSEYEPMGADNSLITAGLPGACLVSDPATVLGVPPAGVGTDDAIPFWDAGQGSCDETFAASPIRARNHAEHFEIVGSAAHAGYLVLRLRSYPAWRVEVNGRPIDDLPKRDDGLIAVPVPRGSLNMTLDWITTPDVIAGRWLSALAVLLATGLCFLERKLSSPRL